MDGHPSAPVPHRPGDGGGVVGVLVVKQADDEIVEVGEWVNQKMKWRQGPVEEEEPERGFEEEEDIGKKLGISWITIRYWQLVKEENEYFIESRVPRNWLYFSKFLFPSSITRR